MISNVENEIKKIKVKASFQSIFGWIIALLSGLFTFAGIAASGLKEAIDVVMVTLFAIITALGIWMIIKSSKRKKLIVLFRNYAARLESDPDKSLDLLSSSIGASVDTVTKNISEMVSLGLFPNAFVDTTHNRLVFQNNNKTVAQASYQNTASVQKEIRYVTVQCKGCGATNKIIAGSIGECEYCGAQVSE